MSYRGRSSGRGRKENDGKYLRLTGLWPSKKNDALWTGKFRNQDLEKLIEKCEQADKAGADLVVFLWENKEKDGQKDPDFTVQVSISEDDGKSRRGGRSSGSGGSSRRDRDDRDDQDDNGEDQNGDDTDNKDEEEEKPRRGKAKDKEEPRSRRSGSSKKDKSDW